MYIKSVEIRNFTVFKDLNIDFIDGINVLIGENGTGKTQLIKSIYADLKISKSNDIKEFWRYFKSVNKDNETFDKENEDLTLKVHISECKSKMDSQCEVDISYPESEIKCTFIPAKDMLTHSKGFIAMSDKFNEFPFDKTLIDIIKVAEEWNLKTIPQIGIEILPKLEKMMEGKVVKINNEFYIEKNNGKLVNFSVEAEGIKKIGLLWQLIMNENITENSVLLWDEPEANINPKFIPELVEILLHLQRFGVQIYITTHSYILAKYFGVKKRDTDKVKYYSLFKDDSNSIVCESNEKFEDLQNNAIRDTFIDLYKDEIERAMN